MKYKKKSSTNRAYKYQTGGPTMPTTPSFMDTVTSRNLFPPMTSTPKQAPSSISKTIPLAEMNRGTVGTTQDFSYEAPEGYKANVSPYTPHLSGRALLKQGTKGEEVKQLQSLLKAKGLYEGAIDGIYGPKTKSAVSTFQSQFNEMPRDWALNSKYKGVIKPGQGIDVDGIVGDQTRAALEATSARKPMESPPMIPRAKNIYTDPAMTLEPFMERDKTRVDSKNKLQYYQKGGKINSYNEGGPLSFLTSGIAALGGASPLGLAASVAMPMLSGLLKQKPPSVVMGASPGNYKSGGWIGDAVAGMKRKGTVGSFTRQAKGAGMGVQAFANKVAASPENYSTTTRRRANFARNVNK
jgi:hypothetical protein